MYRCVILCFFRCFIYMILLPSGVINDDDEKPRLELRELFKLRRIQVHGPAPRRRHLSRSVSSIIGMARVS